MVCSVFRFSAFSAGRGMSMPIMSLNSHRNSNITRMGIRQEVTSRMASASMRSFSVCLNFSSVPLAALPMLSLT